MNQFVTVAKVVGESSKLVIGAFERWSAARNVDLQEPTLTEPAQWPHHCREQMAQFASDLRRHATQPPVVFYSEHVDMWSMGDVFRRAFPSESNGFYEAESDDAVSLLCYAIPDSDQLQDHLRRELSRKRCAEETRWYLRVVQQAALAWHLSAEAAIVVVRRVVGGMVTDEETEEASQVTASWLRRYNKA